MAQYSLSIVTYERGTYLNTGISKPYHWMFFIQVQIQLGIVHQLRGMPGGFYYQGPEQADLAESGSSKETLEIGSVDESKVQKVHEILKETHIDTVESSGWNCQDWTLDGLERLRAEGFVYDHMTRDTVKEWLKEV